MVSLRALAWSAFLLWAGAALAQLPDPPSLGRPEAAGGLSAPLRSSLEGALSRKDYQQAEQLLVDELKERPDAALYAFLGRLFFADRQYLNAGISLERADRLRPLAEGDRFTLAMAYVVLKMTDRARNELQGLAAASPRDARYSYWLARLEYDAQQFERAASGFRAVLKLDPGFVRAHDNLGLAYEALGRNDDAIESYRTAVAKNREAKPCSPWPGHNLGALLRKIGRLEEAEPALRESLRCDPEFAKASYQLGLVLEKRDAVDEAIVLFQKAAADAAYAEPHYALGRLYRKLERTVEADAELTRFEALRKR